MTTMTRKKHRGIPIGSVRLNPQDLQAFPILLEQEFGPIRFRSVERLADNQLLVHVPPRVAATLDDEEQFNDFFNQQQPYIYQESEKHWHYHPRAYAIAWSSSSISSDVTIKEPRTRKRSAHTKSERAHKTRRHHRSEKNKKKKGVESLSHTRPC